jgi:hypothetical protein
MRKLLQAALETYGYSLKTSFPSENGKTLGGFFFKFILPAAALAGLGYEIRDFSPILASLAYLVGLLVIFRGVLPRCDTRSAWIVLAIAFGTSVTLFAWLDYNWIRKEWTPTFLYLVPTHELVDGERRAFFVNSSGFKGLHDVEIVIKDNKSGAVLENHNYETGIEPGLQNPDAPRYIWVTPSRPWDEDLSRTDFFRH